MCQTSLHSVIRTRPALVLPLLGMLLLTGRLHAAEYRIDTSGAHASITFRIQHLGYSWLVGRFNSFQGSFQYDESDPTAASVVVTIDTASIDSNHAERDKHLRGADFLEVSKYPTARFISKAFEPIGEGRFRLHGELNLHGVLRPIVIEGEQVGAGDDPWGGYRRGFSGRTELVLKDFGIQRDLGPASAKVELLLEIEGIRQ